MQRYIIQKSLNNAQFIVRDLNLSRQTCLQLDWSTTEYVTLKALCIRLQQVRSTNVVDVYDLLHQDGKYGLLYEYHESATLQPDREPKAALKTSYAMANAIADLQRAGLSHGRIERTSWSRDAEGILNLHGFSRDSKLDDKPAQQQDLVDVKRLIQSHLESTTFTGLKNAVEATTDAQGLQALLANELLRDQHRAQLHFSGETTVLDRFNRSMTLTHPLGFAQLTLTYVGTHFVARQVSGEVFVNNRPLQNEQRLPRACVITLGAKERKFHERYAMSWEQSSPEIIQ